MMRTKSILMSALALGILGATAFAPVSAATYSGDQSKHRQHTKNDWRNSQRHSNSAVRKVRR